jgi:hypothetical protein
LAIEFTLRPVQLCDTTDFLSEIALTQPYLRYLFVAVKLRKPCEYRAELLTIDSTSSRLQSGHYKATMSKGGIIRGIATLPDAVKIILPPLNSFPLEGLVTFIAADACRMARNTLEISWISDIILVKHMWQQTHDKALTRMTFMKVFAVVLSKGSLVAIPAW